jgi:beta-xylosidase
MIHAALLWLAPAAATAAWVPDQGDGTYRNPVLTCDYSDPDVMRVGDDYYLVASSFTNVPGLPILHSRDLVNWTIIGHALPRLEPDAHYRVPRRGGGVWAPAIRYRADKFLIYYPDPDRGIFLVTARDPRGPWSEPVLVDSSKGAIDPAPFWDDDGSAWLLHAWAGSRAGFNNVITLKRMNPEGTKTIDAGTNIVDGKELPPVKTSFGTLAWGVTEGPKLYKKDGYYYLFAPSGGVKQGWQGVLRSRSIAGPYEGRNVLDQGRTNINGPHQGSWVTTQAGEDWFIHFQDSDSYGRRVLLEPMRWRNGWPIIGADPDGDGTGEPVLRHRKPKVPNQPLAVPATDDEFDGPLGLQWQWNANPAEDWAELRDGKLRLKSVSGSASLFEVGNLLSQKLPGERFTATAQLRFAPLRDGERAGLAIAGRAYGFIGVERAGGQLRLIEVANQRADSGQPETRVIGPSVTDQPVWLRLSAEPTVTPEPPPPDPVFDQPPMRRAMQARVTFSYSLDGQHFATLGDTFISRPGVWTGAQIGIFAQAPNGTPASTATTVGHADFDWFRVGATQ